MFSFATEIVSTISRPIKGKGFGQLGEEIKSSTWTLFLIGGLVALLWYGEKKGWWEEVE